MKKFFLLLIALSTFAIDSSAQTDNYYVGYSKIFPSTSIYYDTYYTAEMYHWTGSGLGANYYFSSVCFLYNDGTTSTFRSSHGNYILFKYKCREDGFTTFTEQVVFEKTIGNSSGYHAFVKEGNKLHIVNVQTDEIVSTLDYNINDGFLDIVVIDFNPHRAGSMTILVSHNDYLKKYKEFPAPSRIDNVQEVKSNSSKKYNLEGIEIDSSSDGFYIQDGKKILNKK